MGEPIESVEQPDVPTPAQRLQAECRLRLSERIHALGQCLHFQRTRAGRIYCFAPANAPEDWYPSQAQSDLWSEQEDAL